MTNRLKRFFFVLAFPSGWEYLLAKPYNRRLDWSIFWCRLKGHPNGIIYYCSSGDCPDTRCKDCGEDIG